MYYRWKGTQNLRYLTLRWRICTSILDIEFTFNIPSLIDQVESQEDEEYTSARQFYLQWLFPLYQVNLRLI